MSDVVEMLRYTALAYLTATASALAPASVLRPLLRASPALTAPAALSAPLRGRARRTRTLLAQYGAQDQLPAGWTSGFDQTSQSTYYVNDQTGESQWEQPQSQPQSQPQWEQPQAYEQSSSAVLWRVAPFSGVRCYVHRGVQPRCYEMRKGDVQVLSRFSMLTQKLTVSRVQCIVQIHDGTATLSACGRDSTLWRGRGLPWVALNNGDQVPLTDGDQISLDCNDPEAAVYTCEEQAQQEQGAAQQDTYAQLPYPWEQLADQEGNVYYSNTQTGESQWEAPQQGAW